MSFDKVISGITKYLNNEIFSNMNDWQEMIERVAVARMIGNSDRLKEFLSSNTFIKTFAIVDDKGDVDVEGLLHDIREHIKEKGKLSVSLPIFGNFTFTADDVDLLQRTIMEENR